MKPIPSYNITEKTNEFKTQFLFESFGLKSIIKAIEYAPVTKIGTRTVFNLAFGGYDINKGSIIDDINSNNGDMYIVFNTVLRTVPIFFSRNPEGLILVSGSDSHDNFITQCLPNCKKKCRGACKNYQRRIKAYRYFVNKHFEELVIDYVFSGRINKLQDYFVPYIPNQDYDDILV